MDFNLGFLNFGHGVRPILESMVKASLTVALRCFTDAKLLWQHEICCGGNRDRLKSSLNDTITLSDA